ncbi:hypothetical protein [uncultured Pseudoflavonifractor sp.]|uniref:hypothetical protein n=1 Tax=uncultured Pseudoflavonifractor sp. TaxID=1221379 RepID=UPI0025E587F5|nr:hypothetical protein [uncultured Pseudoflavonifractor sp.]
MSGHIHEENHGPGCICGCHDHDHHHHHGHADDPAHGLVDNALVLSGKWTVHLPEAAAAGAITQSVAVKLTALAKPLAVDGAVAGHVKALIQCGSGSMALSVTRLGTVDRAQGMGWKPDTLVRRYDVTVNVLSLLNTDAVTREDLDRLFGGEEGAETV